MQLARYGSDTVLVPHAMLHTQRLSTLNEEMLDLERRLKEDVKLKEKRLTKQIINIFEDLIIQKHLF